MLIELVHRKIEVQSQSGGEAEDDEIVFDINCDNPIDHDEMNTAYLGDRLTMRTTMAQRFDDEHAINHIITLCSLTVIRMNERKNAHRSK